MEPLTINTGLESFVMPDKIIHITETEVKAIKTFNEQNLILSLKLETLAQVCALHTRYRSDFKRHAFLLKVNSFSETSSLKRCGTYEITGSLTAAGKSAFAYTISARIDNDVMFMGDLLIAVADYDDTFNQQELTKHYRSIFSCLTTNIQKS